MTNRKFISVFILLSAGLGSWTYSVRAMTEVPQISMTIDAPLELEQFFPRIGHYATPYDFATPLVVINSSILIDLMPGNLIQAVGKDCTLQASLVIWAGLATNPAHYNVVFHQILGNWMGLKEAENLNVTISAGLFAAQGVKAGVESIAFEALGNLNVNRHDVLYYSPDNGRFYPESGREAVSFWLVGTYGGRLVASYNLMLLSNNAKKLFADTVEIAKNLPEQECINVLLNGLHSLEKVIRKEDQAVLAGSIRALERMQIVQPPVIVPAKKPAEIKRDAAGDLALLNSNLRALEAAVKKEKPKSLIEVQQQAATEALLSEIEARELQSQEDALFAISLDKS